MVGSLAVGAFVAHAAFWILLAWGAITGALRWPHIAAGVLLWIAGRAALTFTSIPPTLFVSYVALLDIVLVLVVFKGDVRIT